MAFKVALVNTKTNYVINIIMIESHDVPPKDHVFIEIPFIEVANSIFHDIDLAIEAVTDIPRKQLFNSQASMPIERHIHLNHTKWTVEKGFFE